MISVAVPVICIIVAVAFLLVLVYCVLSNGERETDITLTYMSNLQDNYAIEFAKKNLNEVQQLIMLCGNEISKKDICDWIDIKISNLEKGKHK